jgi:hypothetical protein
MIVCPEAEARLAMTDHRRIAESKSFIVKTE